MSENTRPSPPKNSLWGLTREEVESLAHTFVQNTGLGRFQLEFEYGSALAHDPWAFEVGGSLETSLTDEQKLSLDREKAGIGKQLSHLPWAMWQLVLLCALGAATQGWDETVINGGN